MRLYSPLLGLVTQVGLMIVAGIIVGLLLGLWIDDQLGSRPLFTLVLSLVGTVAGSFSAIRVVTKSFERVLQANKPPVEGKESSDDSDDKPARGTHT